MCNCRSKDKCPLNGRCLERSVIYQATVETDNSAETYVGLTENEFKTRFNSHNASFNNTNRRNTTELSKHVWTLKDQGMPYKISWKIIEKANAYSNNTKRCMLCICEKYHIIYNHQQATLNKRTEILNTCRHSRKYLLTHPNSIT